jgi:hypothetical protein
MNPAPASIADNEWQARYLILRYDDKSWTEGGRLNLTYQTCVAGHFHQKSVSKSSKSTTNLNFVFSVSHNLVKSLLLSAFSSFQSLQVQCFCHNAAIESTKEIWGCGRWGVSCLMTGKQTGKWAHGRIISKAKGNR